MRPRKLVIGGIVTVIVLGIGFIGVKATISPNSAPQPVTQAKQEIVPNHVYQSYRYPYKLTIVRPAAKLYSRPAGTRGCQYLGTVHSRMLPPKSLAKFVTTSIITSELGIFGSLKITITIGLARKKPVFATSPR